MITILYHKEILNNAHYLERFCSTYHIICKNRTFSIFYDRLRCEQH